MVVVCNKICDPSFRIHFYTCFLFFLRDGNIKCKVSYKNVKTTILKSSTSFLVPK